MRIMRFADIPGQQKIKEELITSVKNNKLSHSIMLVGNEGYGALPLALALASYINCENKGERDSCGECPSCRKSDKMIHPDIHFTFSTYSDSGGKQFLSEKFIPQWRSAIETNPYMTDLDWLTFINSGNKQGNIYIADCHQIIKNLSLTTYESGAKIQIIWQAQNLGNNANSLLKIIEEPSPKTYFIFIAPSTDKILSTILSRTRVYSLPPFNPEDIEAELRKRSEDETFIKEIALRANGDMNEALKQLGNIADNDNMMEKLRNWFLESYFMKRVELYKTIGNFSEMSREQAKEFLNYALRIIRESIVHQYDDKKLSHFSHKESEFLQKFGSLIKGKNVYQMVEDINQAMYHIERNANIKFVFFHLSLQFYKLFGEGQKSERKEK